MYFFSKSGYEKCTFSEKVAMKNVFFFKKSLFFLYICTLKNKVIYV